jgi:hypothetical protein
MDQTAPANPTVRPFRFAMLVPTLVVDGVLPIALFKGLEGLGVSPIWALAAGCVPPALNNLRAWVKSRRLDPVGILIVGSMASGALASLVSGDIATRIVAERCEARTIDDLVVALEELGTWRLEAVDPDRSIAHRVPVSGGRGVAVLESVDDHDWLVKTVLPAGVEG